MVKKATKDFLATFWWNEAKNEAHQAIFKNYRRLRDANKKREKALMIYLRMYQNLDVATLMTPFEVIPDLVAEAGPTFNIVKSIIDTLSAKIAANLPKPTFSVEGGDPTLHRTAKEFDRFVFGVFNSANVYDIAKDCFKDAAIGGTGIFHTFNLNGEVACERVFPTELFVDNAEARVLPPQTMYRVLPISKTELLVRYPEAESAILSATPYNDTWTRREGLMDLVEVVQAWHLPSGKDTGDGRWVVCIENETISDVEYTRSTFPFSIYRWSKPSLGFFGEGVTREIVDIQITINEMLMNLQRGIQNFAYPYILVEEGSNINPQSFQANYGNVINYQGTPPQFVLAPAVNPAVKEYLDWLVQRAYELVGVSMTSASGRKPAGLDSGVALRELADQESSRFVLAAQEWERFICDIAEQVIHVAKEIYDEKGTYKVTVKDRAFIGDIDFKGLVDLDASKYKIQVLPTSLLPTTPAGRKQTIQDWLQLGFIDRNTARDLMNFPDIKEEEDLALAARELIREQVERIIFSDDPEYFEQPDPYSDYSYAKEYAQFQYNKRKSQGFPEEILEKLRRYIDQCVTELQKAEQANQPQPPPAPEGQPGGEGQGPANQ